MSSRPTHVRYTVLGLTVAAYAITYMDRQVLATARTTIMKELGISLLAMGGVTTAFRLAYALFQIPGGSLGDKIGAQDQTDPASFRFCARSRATFLSSSCFNLALNLNSHSVYHVSLKSFH